MADLLLVEDDSAIAMGLSYALEQEGHAVLVCPGKRAALAALEERNFDLAVLDVTLPDGTGYEVCRALRGEEKKTAVIFLTVLGEEGQVVKGLDMGADDYIVKPFRLRELLSRVRTVLRRAEAGEVVQTGRLAVFLKQGRAELAGQAVPLTALEYRLLAILAQNKGQLLTRARLLEEIWDVGGDFVNDNTLTVYIKRLREKIEEDVQNPVFIKTVRGLGYRLGSEK